MIDLNYYANIGNVANQLGGMKKTAFNKKMLAAAEASWDRLPADFVMRINQEIPYGKQVMNSFVVPSGIMVMNGHALYIVPCYDIIWIYGHICRTSVNLIPAYKEHTLQLLTRSGETFTMGMKTTAAISRKDPCGDAIAEIQPFLANTRPGAMLGWSDQLAEDVRNNFSGVVQMVDSRG